MQCRTTKWRFLRLVLFPPNKTSTLSFGVEKYSITWPEHSDICILSNKLSGIWLQPVDLVVMFLLNLITLSTLVSAPWPILCVTATTILKANKKFNPLYIFMNLIKLIWRLYDVCGRSYSGHIWINNKDYKYKPCAGQVQPPKEVVYLYIRSHVIGLIWACMSLKIENLIWIFFLRLISFLVIMNFSFF